MDPDNDDDKFTCEICAGKFSSKSNMMRHKRMSHGQQILYVCDTCGTTFKRFDNLKQHRKKFHSAAKSAQDQPSVLTEDSDDQRFQCNECNALFLSQGDLQKHKSSCHTCIQTFVCHTCGRVFDQRKKYLKHLDSHRQIPSTTSRKRKSQSETPHISTSKYKHAITC